MKITQVIFLLCFVGYSEGSFAQAVEEIEREIEIKAIAGLKYDLTRIKVKPGERIKLTLKNVDEMEHNLVITKPGSRQEVVDASHKLGENGPRQHYVPLSDKVLWTIPIVTPGESATIVFQAPTIPGKFEKSAGEKQKPAMKKANRPAGPKKKVNGTKRQ